MCLAPAISCDCSVTWVQRSHLLQAATMKGFEGEQCKAECRCRHTLTRRHKIGCLSNILHTKGLLKLVAESGFTPLRLSNTVEV